MKLVFADHPVPQNITKSLFLAGPSPRSHDVLDWRHKALEYLETVGFDGTVFLPIPEKRFYGNSDSTSWNYDDQVDWECKCRHVADIIFFWVPRDIQGQMPAFVTNVEFGEDLSSGKIVYGRPATAEKCKYLDKRIVDMGLPVHETLEATLNHAIELLGDGAFRSDGEVYVPLFIWKTTQFQSWYENIKKAGNRLDEAKLLSHITFKNKFTFAYIIKAKIWVADEQRHKENEFVFSRTDISSVVAYYRKGKDTKIVLVKEFRSPVNNPSGFVYELPGGSASKDGVDPRFNAQQEMVEEVGVIIEDLKRFEFVGKRQLMATCSTHQSHVYKVELNDYEYQILLSHAKNKTVFGEEGSSEKTHVEIKSISELKGTYIDYSMLGMIFEATSL